MYPRLLYAQKSFDSDDLIAFGWSIVSPSISHLNSCLDRLRTSDAFRGHWYLPSSRRLYKRQKPSLSLCKAFILSHLLPQNRKSELLYGSSSNVSRTMAISPSMLRLISTYPVTRYIFLTPEMSPNISFAGC